MRPARAPVNAGVLAGIAAGGALGALLRYGLTSWVRATSGVGYAAGMVLAINVAGSFLMGVLVVWVVRRPGPGWLRPFLGTGVLGGFTTFSTYAADTRGLLADDSLAAGVGYLLLTPALAIGACWLGVQLMDGILGGRLPAEPESGDR